MRQVSRGHIVHSKHTARVCFDCGTRAGEFYTTARLWQIVICAIWDLLAVVIYLLTHNRHDIQPVARSSGHICARTDPASCRRAVVRLHSETWNRDDCEDATALKVTAVTAESGYVRVAYTATLDFWRGGWRWRRRRVWRGDSRRRARRRGRCWWIWQARPRRVW